MDTIDELENLNDNTVDVDAVDKQDGMSIDAGKDKILLRSKNYPQKLI